METVHIDNLQEWRKNNPDVKSVIVDHKPFGLVIYTFNYIDPQEIPGWAQLGAYDCFGNFHFIDDEGTYHKCLTQKPQYPWNYKKYKYKY